MTWVTSKGHIIFHLALGLKMSKSGTINYGEIMKKKKKIGRK